MANCKECLHYKVCAREGRIVQIDEHTWDEYNQLDAVEVFCGEYMSADVAPKSEVERLENTYRRAIRKIDNKTITAIRNAKQEVAKEIFEEIESISSDFPLYGNINTVILSERDLAFIKKKYTEGEI